MKRVMSAFLAALMVFSGTYSCNQQKSKSQKPKRSEPAATQNVQQTSNQMDTEYEKMSGNGAGFMNNAQVNAVITSLMNSKDLYIKDFEGKSADITEYQRNPSQYYLIYKNHKESSSYQALNTTPTLNKLSKFDIAYKIYQIEDAENFKGSDLSTPVLDEKVAFDATNLETNKESVKLLYKKLEEADAYASEKSTTQKITDFLFPTAYGKDLHDRILIAAIIFTSSSAIAYLFSFYTIGTISAAAGIVFWMLYWFDLNDCKEWTARRYDFTAPVVGNFEVKFYCADLNQVCKEITKLGTVTVNGNLQSITYCSELNPGL